MSTTVTYKGATIATADNQTKTLLTAGKYMEGDIDITDVTTLIPVPVLHYDIINGYINESGWKYQAGDTNHSDVYEVEEGEKYVLYSGSTVGSRWRIVTVASDPDGSTVDLGGTVHINQTSWAAHKHTLITVPTGEPYLAVHKDNASVSGLVTYLYKVASFLDY